MGGEGGLRQRPSKFYDVNMSFEKLAPLNLAIEVLKVMTDTVQFRTTRKVFF